MLPRGGLRWIAPNGGSTIAAVVVALAVSACWAQPAAAQEAAGAADLPVRIVAASSEEPVPDASVTLLTEDSVLVDHAVSDEEGRASLEAPPGTYRIRVERMDVEPWTSDPLAVEGGPGEERTIRVPLRPVTLPGLDVAAEDGRCPGTREERRRGYERYQEVVEALRPVARLEASDRHVFQVRVEEEFIEGKDLRSYEPAPTRTTLIPRPIATLGPGLLAERGYIQPGREGSLDYYAPTAATVISEPFALTHCFRAIEDEAGDRVGLAFEPLPDREAPDVEGEVWLKVDTRAPLSLVFGYMELNQILQRYEVPKIVADIRRRIDDHHTFHISRKIDDEPHGGQIVFEQIEDGSWITRKWWIRMPILWHRAIFLANSRTPLPPEVSLYVNASVLQRSGTVEGVARVPGDSTASEAASGGR